MNNIKPNIQVITTGLGPEIRRLGKLESDMDNIELQQSLNTNMISRLNGRDFLGNYKTRGWFVQVHEMMVTPNGLILLGSEITNYHGVSKICFRSQNNLPFLGTPQNPIYLPKTNNIGFRAMTIYKIPKTGYYDFRILSDDGSKLMYQVVDNGVKQIGYSHNHEEMYNPDIMTNEKNIRNTWTPIIDQWKFQTETWKTSKKLYFNQSDMVLLRFDHFQADGNSAACIKVRYSQVESDLTNNNDDAELEGDYEDLKLKDMHCSLLWSNVPLMGIN
jgi:hypothetical protein